MAPLLGSHSVFLGMEFAAITVWPHWIRGQSFKTSLDQMTWTHCNSLNKCDRDYGFPQRLLIFNWWQLAQRRLPVDGPSSRQSLSKRLQIPLGNRAIWTSGCRIQGVSKVVRPCKARRNSQPLEVSWRGMTKQYMWVLLGNFSKISQRNISVGRWAKESPNKPPFLCLPMSGIYLVCDQR